jgi:hypothetical protein
MMKGLVLSIAVVLLSISASSARAQVSRTPPMSERDRNLRDRELQITLLERGSKEPAKREPQLLLKEINEDFARLQVINNEMITKSTTNIVLDFKYVSEAASEIKKRSSRLRTNLVFPESGKEEKRQSSPADGLKSRLATLDRLIKSFVTNPVFTDAGVIDAELAAKARGDLDEIIDLSEIIKKHAATLNKANPNSH